MSNRSSQKPIAWAFIIALIAGGFIVFIAVAGRMNQRIEEEKAKNAAAAGTANTTSEAPVPPTDATSPAAESSVPAELNANPEAQGAAEQGSTGNPQAEGSPQAAPEPVPTPPSPGAEDAD